ncbi:MAG: DUF3783 domain-containing protein [Thermoplasmata archaeon]|nr:DUF3783 domain-containing protein [Thermoplasmata archaeon]
MPAIGILTYGYDETSALEVQEMLASMLESEIVLIGASGKDDVIVGQILKTGPSASTFGDAETKVLMLLGFDDDQIGLVLENYPKKGRPIFCALTRENNNWDMKTLIVHLLEEKKILEISE